MGRAPIDGSPRTQVMGPQQVVTEMLEGGSKFLETIDLNNHENNYPDLSMTNHPRNSLHLNH